MDLQAEFALPCSQFFRYLQLRHALQVQSRHTQLDLPDPLLIQEVLLESDKEGMISRSYNILPNATQDSSKLPCRWGWETDASTIDGETWDICLSSAPLVSVSASQKLSHLYLLHRVYRTPSQLCKWGNCNTPICPKCERDHGDLIHLLWRCLKLFHYWTEVLDVISQVFMFSIPQTPVVCLLGVLEEESLTPQAHTAVLRLLYIARKLIAQYWIVSRVPTRWQWVELVNKLLIREKLTYQHRNVSRKFYSMWQSWLDVTDWHHTVWLETDFFRGNTFLGIQKRGLLGSL